MWIYSISISSINLSPHPCHLLSSFYTIRAQIVDPRMVGQFPICSNFHSIIQIGKNGPKNIYFRYTHILRKLNSCNHLAYPTLSLGEVWFSLSVHSLIYQQLFSWKLLVVHVCSKFKAYMNPWFQAIHFNNHMDLISTVFYTFYAYFLTKLKIYYCTT